MRSPRHGPVLLYELNEVPWRVVDHYVRKRPHSALALMIPRSRTFTSHTRDTGELHPWTTWPTLHRAVYSSEHRIRFLNQDLSCATAYPPIWEIAGRAGVRVGVFGSLQSYPPAPDINFEFFVPDTFAPKPDAWPKHYSIFQRLNLRQTQRDGGSPVDISVDLQSALDLVGLFSIGMSARTFAQLVKQVVLERIRPIHRTRRSLMQAPLAFDVFKHALEHTEPEFATFFTNHVAGIMHRYWKHSFPEDFGYVLSGPDDEFRAENLIAAMDIADRHVGILREFVEQRGGALVIASSMGQQAIERDDTIGEVRIADNHTFLSAIGFEGIVEPRPAMQPDFNFECVDEKCAEAFSRCVTRTTDLRGNPVFFRVQTVGRTVNCALGNEPGFVKDEKIRLGWETPARVVAFNDVGMRVITRDAGTGYHQPYGIVIFYSRHVKAESNRGPIESIEIAPMILKLLGIDQSRVRAPQRRTA